MAYQLVTGSGQTPAMINCMKPWKGKALKMNPRITLASSAIFTLFIFISGCTFFEAPVQLDDLATAEPTSPPVPTSSTTPRQVVPSNPVAASTNASNTIFTIGLLEDLPDDAVNIAVVHFSVRGSNRDTERDVAMCRAMLETIPPTRIDQIPPSPGTIVLWPVSNSNTGSTCLEMLTNYDPVDISNETARKVNDTVAGPFLLTRNNKLRKRMIFDMSYRSRQSIKNAIGEWQALLGSDPENWPAYRSSR
ncbi:hypothetical protein AB833_06520 [Chromatiales bacterium (ex Bugula neritina AB1)]|nr:hypothetical protein AB833_06520 [Chromatiales bacterium (ex Bugula neritina AB1)]